MAKPEGKKPLEDLGIHRIILKQIFKELDGTLQPGLIRFRTGVMADFCKHDNDPLSSIKCGEIISFSRNLLRGVNQ